MLDVYHNNLPIQPTPLIGREKEIVTIQQFLLRQDVRLFTLLDRVLRMAYVRGLR